MLSALRVNRGCGQLLTGKATSRRPVAACRSTALSSSASLTSFNQKLIDLDNQLSARGLTALIDWPRIVFCGDQSSGKSSIIQRIAHINLPRADGTCTCCPMELRMKHGKDPWSCTIKIRYMYDDNGSPLDSVKEELFCKVTKREHVEASVARAQIKILQRGGATVPGHEGGHTETKKLSSQVAVARVIKKTQIRLRGGTTNPGHEGGGINEPQEFTKNVIVLEIHGGFVNLNLVDLPGIVRSTSNSSNKHIISTIRSINAEYIRDVNSIIVATITCKNDLQNQEIHQLALESPAGAQRTLGVLTKPDSIELRCHDSWMQLMRNDSDPRLDLGFYMVRNPPQVDVEQGVGPQEAEVAESAFFKRTEALRPLLADPVLKTRLGIQPLVAQLSGLLISRIKEQLPITQQQVKERMELVEADLKQLPPAVDRSKRAALITRTVRDLSLLLDPNIIHKRPQPDEMKQLYQGLWASRHAFAHGVLVGRPAFIIEAQQTAQPMKNGVLLDYKEDWEPALEAVAFMTLTQVEGVMSRNRTVELPTDVPTSARVEVITTFTSNWKILAHSFLNDLATVFSNALLRLVSVQPLLRDCPALCSKFRACLWPLLEEKAEAADKRVQDIVLMTAGAPLTALDTYFSSCKQKALEHINQQSRGLPGSTAGVIADAMAFHKVASKLFIDSVVLVIQSTFVDAVAAELPEQVESHLQAIARQDEEDRQIRWQESDAVLDLVEYAPEIEGKRKTLSAAKEGLQQISRLLREVLN